MKNIEITQPTRDDNAELTQNKTSRPRYASPRLLLMIGLFILFAPAPLCRFGCESSWIVQIGCEPSSSVTFPAQSAYQPNQATEEIKKKSSSQTEYREVDKSLLVKFDRLFRVLGS